MKLGINLGYQDWGAGLSRAVELAQRADALGFSSAWTAEAYGTDAVTPLTWLAACTNTIHLGTGIMQMPARSPAMTAMTAATLDAMSQGRFLLGLGASGPQVAEGWHGQAYGKPLTRTREYVAIVRDILRREAPLEHHGEYYDIPYSGPGATGLGKPLKLLVHPRADIPIYLAAIGPKNVALAAEVADGWLPIFFSPFRFRDVFGGAVDEGRKKRATPGDAFDIAPTCAVIVGDDVDALAGFVRPQIALYVGGMGARGRNFYNDLACRYGFEAEAKEIQDLYLDGKKQEAAAAVPLEMIDEVCLIGPKERIADRLAVWKESGVGTLIMQAAQPEALELMAELAL
jgi:F420-dependent oxidoreductase-like protein